MSNGNARPLKIGRISYTNAWPVFHHFDAASLRDPAEIVSELPSALNRKLREGEIDIAAISSYAYGLSSDAYYVMPNLSVSTHGPVQSILLFLKSPLEKVIHGKIALTTASATSVNLLKIIMEKFYGGKPTYEDAEPSLGPMLENADAALLIGDHAIRASWENLGYRVLDLGEVWNLWTGHWMTYALWAVRREVAHANPEAVQAIYDGLTESKRLSLADLEPVVAKATQQIGGTSSYWRNYFGNIIRYDFGPRQKAGLELYFRYAQELNLIDRPVELLELPQTRFAGNIL